MMGMPRIGKGARSPEYCDTGGSKNLYISIGQLSGTYASVAAERIRVPGGSGLCAGRAHFCARKTFQDDLRSGSDNAERCPDPSSKNTEKVIASGLRSQTTVARTA